MWLMVAWGSQMLTPGLLDHDLLSFNFPCKGLQKGFYGTKLHIYRKIVKQTMNACIPFTWIYQLLTFGQVCYWGFRSWGTPSRWCQTRQPQGLSSWLSSTYTSLLGRASYWGAQFRVKDAMTLCIHFLLFSVSVPLSHWEKLTAIPQFYLKFILSFLASF